MARHTVHFWLLLLATVLSLWSSTSADSALKFSLLDLGSLTNVTERTEEQSGSEVTAETCSRLWSSKAEAARARLAKARSSLKALENEMEHLLQLADQQEAKCDGGSDCNDSPSNLEESKDNAGVRKKRSVCESRVANCSRHAEEARVQLEEAEEKCRNDTEVLREEHETCRAELATLTTGAAHCMNYDPATHPDITPTCDGYSLPCGPYKVICYINNGAWYRQGIGKFEPRDIEPSLCTHIVYAVASLNTATFEVVKPHNDRIHEQVVRFRSKGVKVILGVGGGGLVNSEIFSRFINNAIFRERWISHIKAYLKANQFDGVELMWMHPVCWQNDCKRGPASDKQAFVHLVRELRIAVDNVSPTLLLSASVTPSKWIIDSGYSVSHFTRYLDWITIQSFDYYGSWNKQTGHVSPLYHHPLYADATKNTIFSVNYWMSKGTPKCKIIMGIPLFGRSFSLVNSSRNGVNAPAQGAGEAGSITKSKGLLAYYEICSSIRTRGWSVVQDPLATMGPYAFQRDQWVGYDDVTMVRRKAEFVKARGLGGAMLWAIDFDDFSNACGFERFPLVKTVNRALCRLSSAPPNCTTPATPH